MCALPPLALLAIATAAPAQEPAATGRQAGNESQAVDQGPVTAVWKKERIAFAYRSSLSVYSCDALRNRVASILYAVGARPDMEIKITNCSRSVFTPDSTSMNPVNRTWQPGAAPSYARQADYRQVSTVDVLLSVPVEMTPDVVSELKADKSRRELISRVTGDPVPRFDDPIPFAAERRLVTVSYQTVGIEAAECELLDQLVSSSFKDLGLRVVHQGYSCDPRRISNIRPTLDVEALVPVTFESRETGEAPTAEDAEVEQDVTAAPVENPPEPATDPPPE